MKKLTKIIAITLVTALLLNFIPVSSALTVTDDSDKLVLYGSAKKASDYIELTPLKIWSSGSVWYRNPIDITSGFETWFEFYAGGGRDNSYGGADGICLTFSEKPGLGSDGEYLGFVTGNTSYGVELDSYPHNPGDPDGKHIAVINGTVANHLTYVLDDRTDDSKWHTLRVAYDHSKKTLTVDLDNKSLLTGKNVNMANYMYLGISAATGAGYNKHFIRNFYLEGQTTGGDVTDNSPIIVVPGIMGSRLLENGDRKLTDHKDYLDPFDNKSVTVHNQQVWPPLTTNSAGNEVSGNVELARAIGYHYDISWSSLMERKDLLVPELSPNEYGALDTYKTIVNGLKANFPNRTVLFFSYDWRQSNADSADKLNAAINKVLKDYKAKKVNIVAHSMGGLVTSKYYAAYGGDKLNNVITCGTPYEGAPKLIDAVLNHAVDGQPLELLGLSRDIKSRFNGVAQLVPTKRYNSVTPQIKSRPGYGDLEVKLTDDEYTSYLKKIFSDKIAMDAQSFQKSILGKNGYNVLLDYDKSFFIVGRGKRTPTAVAFMYEAAEVWDIRYDNNGDGTVPYQSATMCGKLGEKLDASRYCEVNADHDGTINKQVDKICNAISKGSFDAPSDPAVNKKYIVIRVACPVDVRIERNGEYLSSSDDDLSLTASFGRLDIVGENNDIKMLCVDDYDDYSIKLQGTDAGTMDYGISRFDEDNFLIEENVFSDVPVTEKTKITTDTDAADGIALNVDKDGNGKVKTYKPDKPKESYTVSFNGNGGKIGSTDAASVKKVKVGKNGKTALPDAEIMKRSGKLFAGWYTAKTGGTKISGTQTNAVTKNVTYYAHWKSAVSAAPKAPKLTNPKAGSLKIANGGTKVSGVKYEIQYATDGKFTKNLKTASSFGEVRGLKKGKTYYVRVRAWKYDSTGKKVNGKWSAKSKLTLKK